MAKFKVGDVVKRDHGPAQHYRIIIKVLTQSYVSQIFRKGESKFQENSHDVIEVFFKKAYNDCGKIWRSLKQ